MIRETCSPILMNQKDQYGHKHWQLWIEIKDRTLPVDNWEGTYLAIYESGDVHRVEIDGIHVISYLVGDFSNEQDQNQQDQHQEG